MIKKLIYKHIQQLTTDDIVNFALENNIILNDKEIDIIYICIKKYWEEIIFNDHRILLGKVKDSLEPTTYKKINELIIFYKNKYKNYL